MEADESAPFPRTEEEGTLSYLAEFIWRYVNRGKDLFKVFLKDVARVYKLE